MNFHMIAYTTLNGPSLGSNRQLSTVFDRCVSPDDSQLCTHVSAGGTLVQRIRPTCVMTIASLRGERPPERLFWHERGCQRPGQPGGCFLQELEEHVECRVDIAVCLEPAPRALETRVPSQFVVQRAALAARLRRILFRDHEHVLAHSFRRLDQYLPELSVAEA